MSGPYSYAERVANRAHAAAEYRSSTTTTSRTTTARPTTTTISDAEWNEILLMEQAIHSFEERFEEFMRSQSRLMEDFRVELDDIRAELGERGTAVKQLEAKVLRVEARVNDCDLSELSQRMKSGESALQRAEDRIARAEINIAKHEALVGRVSALAQHFKTLDHAIIEIRETFAHRDSDGLASHVSAGSSVGTHQSQSTVNELSAAAGPTTERWPALRIFFQALDQFGEDLNGFSMYDNESNSS